MCELFRLRLGNNLRYLTAFRGLAFLFSTSTRRHYNTVTLPATVTMCAWGNSLVASVVSVWTLIMVDIHIAFINESVIGVVDVEVIS